MNHLFIDTSNKYLTVVVTKDYEILSSISYEAWQRQSEFLIPEIKNCLNKANLTLKDIDHICVGNGPGSYTGVRIALTVAKVLGTISPIKVSVVSSLAIMGTKELNYIAIMDARSKRSYIGVYQKGVNIIKDQILPNEEVLKLIDKYKKDNFLIIGEGKHLNVEAVAPDIIKGLMSYGYNKEVEDILSLKPIYLRDAL